MFSCCYSFALFALHLLDAYSQSHSFVYQGPPPTLIATTVLRKFNEQWRIMSHHAVPYSASTSSLYCDDKLEVLDTLQRRSPSSSSSATTSSSSSSSTSSSAVSGSSSRDGVSDGSSSSSSSNEKDFRQIVSAGSNASIGGGGSSKGGVDSNGLGDSTNVWRKLHGLMQEEGSGATSGVVTRRNSDGGVERVVDIGNVANPAITAYEKGGIFSDSAGEEMGGSSGSLIESLVLQSAKDIFGVRFSLFLLLTII